MAVKTGGERERETDRQIVIVVQKKFTGSWCFCGQHLGSDFCYTDLTVSVNKNKML